MRILVVAFVFLAAAAMAQENERPEDLVIIGMRTLDRAELAQYRAIERDIECAFDDNRNVTEIVETIQRLSNAISSTGLFPAATDSLHNRLGEQAFIAAEEPIHLAESLLSASDGELRGHAFTYLLNAEDWHQHEALRDELLRLLDDSRTKAEDRATILWLFALQGWFATVHDKALELARDHADASLAHSIAGVIVAAHEGDASSAARFAVSDVRALREEAVRFAYRCNEAQPSTTAMLLAIAKDTSEPAWVRGDAIETLALCPDDPVNQAALLELLKPSSWFFGATGQHFYVHSLALVIDALAQSNDPAIRSRLAALRSDVATLRSGEREYVEWILAVALGEHREIFEGPVDPKR